MPNIYEDRFVLFLDILGFQRIIDNTFVKEVEQTDKVKSLISALIEMKKVFSPISKVSTVSVTQFSDSVVVSLKETGSIQFFNFLRQVQLLICRLAKNNILVGGQYHMESFIILKILYLDQL